jgi:hypothetical protein
VDRKSLGTIDLEDHREWSHSRMLHYLLILWGRHLGCRNQTVAVVPSQQPPTALWMPTTEFHILSAKGRVMAWGLFLAWTDRGCLDARDLPGADGVAQDLASRGGVASVLRWHPGHSAGTGHL